MANQDQTEISHQDKLIGELSDSQDTYLNRKLLFTIKEAAEELRISITLLYRMIQTNQITTVKIGSRRFIAFEDLVNFINEQKEKRYAS